MYSTSPYLQICTHGPLYTISVTSHLTHCTVTHFFSFLFFTVRDWVMSGQAGVRQGSCRVLFTSASRHHERFCSLSSKFSEHFRTFAGLTKLGKISYSICFIRLMWFAIYDLHFPRIHWACFQKAPPMNIFKFSGITEHFFFHVLSHIYIFKVSSRIFHALHLHNIFQKLKSAKYIQSQHQSSHNNSIITLYIHMERNTGGIFTRR